MEDHGSPDGMISDEQPHAAVCRKVGNFLFLSQTWQECGNLTWCFPIIYLSDSSLMLKKYISYIFFRWERKLSQQAYSSIWIWARIMLNWLTHCKLYFSSSLYLQDRSVSQKIYNIIAKWKKILLRGNSCACDVRIASEKVKFMSLWWFRSSPSVNISVSKWRPWLMKSLIQSYFREKKSDSNFCVRVSQCTFLFFLACRNLFSTFRELPSWVTDCIEQ